MNMKPQKFEFEKEKTEITKKDETGKTIETTTTEKKKWKFKAADVILILIFFLVAIGIFIRQITWEFGLTVLLIAGGVRVGTLLFKKR